MLEIRCEKCDAYLFHYQKDGPGPLKRVYSDRIYNNKNYSDLAITKLTSQPPIKCAECQTVIGVPINYKKEDRLAFRLFQSSVVKKIVSRDSVSL